MPFRLHSASSPPPYSWGERREAWRHRWSQPAAWSHAALFLALVAAFLWQASLYWPRVIDDAYITFRFSDNLIHGHGLRFNPGGHRVEGFTNFLWMLLMGLPLAVGWDVMLFAKLLGLGSAVAVLATSWSFARTLRGRDDVWNLLPVAFLAFNASFAHWALMGLETTATVALILGAYVRLLHEARDSRLRLLSPWLATLAAISRLDSLLFLAPLGVYGLALSSTGRLPWRRAAAWVAAAGLSFGAFYGWKVHYFGDWLPNTYYAKQRLVEERARVRGPAQIYQFYVNAAGAALLPVRPEARSADPPTLDRVRWSGSARGLGWINWWVGSLAILLLLPTLEGWMLIALPLALGVFYVHYVDGDWMPNFRFFQVSLPFLAVAGAAALGRIEGRLKRSAARTAVRTGFALAVALVGAEQLRVGWVRVYDRDPFVDPRPAGWATPAEVWRRYGGASRRRCPRCRTGYCSTRSTAPRCS